MQMMDVDARSPSELREARLRKHDKELDELGLQIRQAEAEIRERQKAWPGTGKAPSTEAALDKFREAREAGRDGYYLHARSLAEEGWALAEKALTPPPPRPPLPCTVTVTVPEEAWSALEELGRDQIMGADQVASEILSRMAPKLLASRRKAQVDANATRFAATKALEETVPAKAKKH
jgi:hypothetical protein